LNPPFRPECKCSEITEFYYSAHQSTETPATFFGLEQLGLNQIGAGRIQFRKYVEDAAIPAFRLFADLRIDDLPALAHQN
jgi:hypothetical protein